MQAMQDESGFDGLTQPDFIGEQHARNEAFGYFSRNR
jgi:hypothetical protein